MLGGSEVLTWLSSPTTFSDGLSCSLEKRVFMLGEVVVVEPIQPVRIKLRIMRKPAAKTGRSRTQNVEINFAIKPISPDLANLNSLYRRFKVQESSVWSHVTPNRTSSILHWNA